MMTFLARHFRILALLILIFSVSGFSTTGTNPQSSPAQTDASKPPQEANSASPQNPSEAPIYKIGGGVTPPKLIHSVEPKFSRKERIQRLNAMTLVQITVSTDGNVKDAKIIKSSLDTMATKDEEIAFSLDRKALDAVNQYRFAPAMRQGKPVPVLLNIEVSFHIF